MSHHHHPLLRSGRPPRLPGLGRYFYRILLCAIIFITALTFSLWSIIDRHAAGRRCFLPPSRSDDANSLPPPFADILLADRKPRAGRTVFFHETSCTAADGVAHLNARQACAIESAALSSPDWDVFVLFAAPSGVHNASTASGSAMPTFFEALVAYENVHLRTVNLWTYALDTPLADWMRGGALFASSYLNSHASDLLRYLSLYKWGGTYLDLDVVLMRDLSTIPANYAGAESANFVAAGVINFDHDGDGHRIAEKCLHEFERSFDGADWGNNGPGVITRVLHTVCATTFPPLMTRSRCSGFRVFDVEAFYAIRWTDWRRFFEPSVANETLAQTAQSYAVHVWNKHSYAEPVHRSPDGGREQGAYGQLAAKYCPRVYAAAGEHF